MIKEPNEAIYNGDGTVTVMLSKGMSTIIDEEDAEDVLRHRWSASNGRANLHYARSAMHTSTPGRYKKMLLHRFLLGDESEEIDHINGDTLDNRRCNLRECTAAENNANAKKRKGCSSKYKGVCWDKRSQKWASNIRVNTVLMHLGLFAREKEAAKAYDAAARKHFGEFARCNFAA